MALLSSENPSVEHILVELTRLTAEANPTVGQVHWRELREYRTGGYR